MIRLYTAVGRFELQKDGNGRKQPIVIVNQKESALSREEMVLWSCLMWNIMTKEEVGESYEKKALQVGLKPSRFEAVLQRMETRHLIISAEAEKGDSALYRLLEFIHSTYSQQFFCEGTGVSAVAIFGGGTVFYSKNPFPLGAAYGYGEKGIAFSKPDIPFLCGDFEMYCRRCDGRIKQ